MVTVVDDDGGVVARSYVPELSPEYQRHTDAIDGVLLVREAVLAAATADDVAQIGASLGYEFSGDELLRLSGKKVGRVTVTKQDIPGEYN